MVFGRFGGEFGGNGGQNKPQGIPWGEKMTFGGLFEGFGEICGITWIFFSHKISAFSNLGCFSRHWHRVGPGGFPSVVSNNPVLHTKSPSFLILDFMLLDFMLFTAREILNGWAGVFFLKIRFSPPFASFPTTFQPHIYYF